MFKYSNLIGATKGVVWIKKRGYAGRINISFLVMFFLLLFIINRVSSSNTSGDMSSDSLPYYELVNSGDGPYGEKSHNATENVQVVEMIKDMSVIRDISISDNFGYFGKFENIKFGVSYDGIMIDSFNKKTLPVSNKKIGNAFRSKVIDVESVYEEMDAGVFNKGEKHIKQSYVLRNLLDVAKNVKFSVVYEIDSNSVAWDGKIYNVSETPIYFKAFDELVKPNETFLIGDTLYFGSNYYDFKDVIRLNYTLSVYSFNGKSYIILEIFQKIEGLGEFIVDPMIGWTSHTIKYLTGNGRSVFAIDVDGDGDIDTVRATEGDNKVEWDENDGSSLPIWTSRTITTFGREPLSVYAIDVDNDGDIDVISGPFQSNGRVAWFENNGSSPPGWTSRNISPPINGIQSVFAVDVDGDSDVDVLSASCCDDLVAWYENDGSSPPSWIAHNITNSADNAQSVYAVDLDRDGDIDVVSGSFGDSRVAWFENDGASPPSWASHNISTSASQTKSVFAIDMDKDADVDVLSASGSQIFWYENDGSSPPSWSSHVINSSVNDARSVYAIDLDHDDDIDVLSASNLDNKIAWYENNGSSPLGWTGHIITTATSGPMSVFAIDIDDDIAIDVVGAFFNHMLNWYESNLTPIEIVNITPVQVIKGTKLVLGKTGLVRVDVKNNAVGTIGIKANVTFEGNTLPTYNDFAIKNITGGTTESFDFRFVPAQAGAQTFTVKVKGS